MDRGENCRRSTRSRTFLVRFSNVDRCLGSENRRFSQLRVFRVGWFDLYTSEIKFLILARKKTAEANDADLIQPLLITFTFF